MRLSLEPMAAVDIPRGMVEAVEHVKAERAAELFPDSFVDLKKWAEDRGSEWSGTGYYERTADGRRFYHGEYIRLFCGYTIPDPYIESCFRFYRENKPRTEEERKTLTGFFLSNNFPIPF